MEEVKVNVAVLKDAIRRVAINDFNQELEKITSVTDLTEEEWSGLIIASVATIECDVFKTARKKDEKCILHLLLEKLVFLSSPRERLRLTRQGFEACRSILNGGYGLDGLYLTLKTKNGYSLLCLCSLYAPWKDHGGDHSFELYSEYVRLKKHADKIMLFKQCYGGFSHWRNLLCEETKEQVNVNEELLDIFLEDVGLDFFTPLSLRETLESNFWLWGDFVTKIAPVLVQKELFLERDKFCRLCIQSFFVLGKRDLFSLAVFQHKDHFFAEGYLRIFRAFLTHDVKNREAKLMYECVINIKQQMKARREKSSEIKPMSEWEKYVENREQKMATVLEESIEKTLALLRSKMPFIRMETVLCIWKLGNIPFFRQVPRDVMKIIGGYVFAENKAPDYLNHAKPV